MWQKYNNNQKNLVIYNFFSTFARHFINKYEDKGIEN